METKGIDKLPQSLRFAWEAQTKGSSRSPGAGVLGKFFSQEAVMEVSRADLLGKDLLWLSCLFIVLSFRLPKGFSQRVTLAL